MSETFDWLKPSILWQQGGADMLRRDFFRPTLHEFTTDKFMEEFLASASAPTPKPFGDSLAKPSAGLSTLKLFQPVHGNFYLTSASLCCHLPGFPDREVRTGDGESVFFVLRKKEGAVEYAWDTSEEKHGWRPLTKPGAVPLNEERLPLFQTSTARGRNIFFGYVPVASRDTYSAAPTSAVPPKFDEDPRLQELDARFIGPLTDTTRPMFGRDGTQSLAPADVQLRLSVYLLLDLWEYLDQYLPEVAVALRDGTTSALVGKSRDLTDYFQSKTLSGTTLSLAAALSKVSGQRAQLNEPGDTDLAALGYTNDFNLHDHALSGLSLLRGKVSDALSDSPETKPAPVSVPKLSTQAGDRYVLRYVYERAQCHPAHVYVSRPTEPFELAPFFDPDAPGRNIRVGLPVDVSIAGLRKFKKNVGFMISKELNKKIEGIAGNEKGILDNDASISDGGIDIGFICSFSLPIITLCAFILLMIIVVLLNLVFWWIPLLKICFPIPLAAKKN
jgi:hypothetical protein